jgi:hypothetical protein
MLGMQFGNDVMKEHQVRNRFAAGAAVTLLAILSSSLVNGQVRQARQGIAPYKAPRTRDGQPDLQGVWTNLTLTPMERPAALAGKQFFTPEEAREYEENDHGPEFAYLFREKGKVVPTLRTSLIIDPADGLIPPLTPEGKQRAGAQASEQKLHGLDGPENRSAFERCIVAPNAGPPMLPNFNNSNYQIVQAPGEVVILSEQVHDARIIPLDSRPHLPHTVRQWMGDSRGHWEGETLVVETTNFSGRTNFAGSPLLPSSAETLRLEERFTRTAADLILYEFTVFDSATFTRPWTAQIPLHPAEGALFEYACQEGNYGLRNILSAARDEERSAAEREAKKAR